MGDKDNNIYNGFQPAFPYYGFVAAQPMKCLMCFQLFPQQSFYPVYQIFCSICMRKLFIQTHPVNTPSPQPMNSPAPILPPVSKIQPLIAPKPQASQLYPPTTFTFPANSLHSLIFICDFASNFSTLMKIPQFSLQNLFESLSDAVLQGVCRDLFTILSLKIVDDAYQQDSEFQITKKLKAFYMGSLVSDVIDVRSVMNCAWARLLGEIIKGKTYAEYFKGTYLESLRKSMPETLTETDLSVFTLEEKLGVLEFLVNAYLDTKEFREYLAEKVEEQSAQLKAKHENRQKIKQIEIMIVNNPDQKEELETERAKLFKEDHRLKRELMQINYRTMPLGSDAKNNEYYYFRFEPDKILVNLPAKNPLNDQNLWGYYQSKDHIAKFCSELLLHSRKEGKLKFSIERILKYPYFKDTIDKIPYINELPKLYKESNIESIKEILKTTEKSFSKYLSATKKSWDNKADEKKWRKALAQSTEVQELCVLLLEFAEKALTPLRKQYVPKQKTNKYRKVLIKLWQNSQDGYKAWQEFMKSICSKEELMLGTEVYRLIIEAYISKKTDEASKHSDECYICNDGGRLIMCESCPRVAHIECMKLKKVPKDDWFCSHCIA